VDWTACAALDTAALGRLGEECASSFLQRRGCDILDRNLSLDVGELDILANIDGEKTLVEVRSIRSRSGRTWLPPHPLDAFDYRKARQVRKVARSFGCRRVDLITVRFHDGGIDLHWVPRAV
jgi:Holliday junction resolvase-like predicted endonuclease